MAKKVKSASLDLEKELKKVQDVNDKNALIGSKAKGMITIDNNSQIMDTIKIINIEDEDFDDRDNLLSIKGTDKKSGLELLDIFLNIYKNESEKINYDNFNKHIREQIRENRFMMSNMDQLGTALEMRKTSLLSPDDASKESFIFNIEKTNGTEQTSVSAMSVSKKLKEEVNFPDLMEKLVDVGSVDGQAILYTLPYSELAKQFQAYIKQDKNKVKSIYESVTGKEPEVSFNITESLDGTMIESIDISYEELENWLEVMDTKPINIKEGFEDKQIFTDMFGGAIIEEAKAAFLSNIRENNITEAAENEVNDLFGFNFDKTAYAKQKVNIKISGVYTKVLDNEKTIPIIIDKKLMGAYIVEEYNSFGMRNIYTTKTLLEKESASTLKLNPLGQSHNMLDSLKKLIERNLNSRFLKTNKHILGTIRDIFNESMNKGQTAKVRFIPAKYLELYIDTPDGTGLGISPLQAARNSIYSVILLNKNMQLTELLYKRPVKIAKVNVSGLNTDSEEFMWKAMEAMQQMYASASLYNISDVNNVTRHMSSIGRLFIPTTPDGKELITVDQLEGQTIPDNMELLRMHEKIIAMIMNTMVSSDEDSYINFATSYANKNIIAHRTTIKRQGYAGPQFSRIATNIYNMINPSSENIKIKITLPPPKSLINTTNNSMITDIVEKGKALAEIFCPDADDEKKKQYFVQRYVMKNLEGLEDVSMFTTQFEDDWKRKSSGDGSPDADKL